MSPWTLAEVAAMTHGEVVRGEPSTPITAITTDSRQVSAGELFIALRGERFDAHDFIGDVAQKGAAAAVIDATHAPELTETTSQIALIGVDDPLLALGRLGQAHRRRLSAKVIAVVGSNGKTTTRELIHHLLSGFLKGHAAIKSFNNAVGVPITLLSAEEDDAYLVVEIGTNAPGEVAQLATLTEPDLAIITSLGFEHLAGFGNLAGVVVEESAILPFVEKGVVIANTDEHLVEGPLSQHPGRIVTFGKRAKPNDKLTAVEPTTTGIRFKINDGDWIALPMPGAHNALNAIGALRVAAEFGIEESQLIARLASFEPPPMRSNVATIAGVTLIDDAYNANPSSMLAAGAMLAGYSEAQRRILVLGAMAELGDDEAAWHTRVAQQLADANFEAVHLLAPLGEWMQREFAANHATSVFIHADVEACGAVLAKDLQAGDVVLFKASRAAKLERVVAHVRDALTARGARHAV